MESFVSKTPLLLSIVILFFVNFLSVSSAETISNITYHNGPILTGNVNLSILWYGNFPNKTKNTIKIFIRSMNRANGDCFVPQVFRWWDEVEKYQAVVNTSIEKVPSISLKIASEVIDEKYSLGKELNEGSIPKLLQLAEKTSTGMSKGVALVFVSKDVTLEDSCEKRCFRHGVIGEQVYIVIKDPIDHCPEKCAWPFHSLDLSKVDIVLTPPNENATDVMIAHLASALASTVTNPYGNGFYAETSDKSTQIEIGDACTKEFGSQAFKGYPGRMHLDPHDGKAFNGHGLNHTRFLIPGLWKPSDGKCWTML